jgi:c(7)-type cytochrome triheme protein
MWKWLVLLGLVAVPGVTFALTDTVRIPIVEPHGADDPAAAAAFSHFKHGEFQCYECHTSVFPQFKRGFTHADMKRGRYCGACHDGHTAWDIDAPEIECEECHRPAPKGKE